MIKDREERRKAVMADGHAFVWASAGTGKTHTLTLRALFLLLMAPFQKRAEGTECAALYKVVTRADRLRAARAVIRRFVLTTFTRKAAAEMQTRLYDYLDRLASAVSLEQFKTQVAQMNEGHGDEQFIEVVEAVREKAGDFGRLCAGAEALAELASELQVSTIHSFAATILRRHPIEAGIPPTARFAEEGDSTAPDVPSLVLERWWQHVQADPDLDTDLRALLQFMSLDQLTEWLREIFEQPWIVEELEFGKPDEKAVKEILDACRGLIAHPKAGALKRVQALNDRVSATDFSWKRLCIFLCDDMTRDALFQDRLKPDKGRKLKEAIASLPPNQQRYFDSWLAMYPHVLAKCLAGELAKEWARWRQFAEKFAKWADGAAVRELGLVTFDDMVRRTARLLGDSNEIRLEERERLWAILVDEFQDTDPVQLELLRHILRREGGKDHDVVGFFVGDLKQSIYRFRKADLPAIAGFVRDFAQLVSGVRIGNFKLTASFRSLRSVTEFVNYLFATSDDVKLPDYAGQELSTVREGTGEMTEWRLLKPADDRMRNDARRDFLAWETARLINDYAKKHGLSGYRDILVLVRSYAELNALLPVLETAGIPVVSSGAKTFFAQPEVLDALNLLIALHNPQDALAVGAVLRSPLVALSDEQIFALLQAVKTRELFHRDKKLPASVPAHARARLEEMRGLATARKTTAFTEWLRQVRQFVPAGAYAQHDGEGRVLVRIDSVLDGFRQTVTQGLIAPLAWLLEQRARASRSDSWDADLGEDVSVTDESVSAVRAMTIHKAKGLEAKYLIAYGWQAVLDACRSSTPVSKGSLLLTGKDGKVVRGCRFPWGKIEVLSKNFPNANELNNRYESDEGRRLAYVATTRPRDRLVLLSPNCGEIAEGLLASEQDAVKLLSQTEGSATIFGGTLRVSVFPAKKGEAGKRQKPIRIKDGDGYATLWQKRLAHCQSQSGMPLLYKPSQPESAEEEEAAELADYVRRRIEQARDISKQAGTLAHAYLERHVKEEGFEETKLKALLALSNDAISEEALTKTTTALKQFFGSKRHQRARRATIRARELPIHLTHDGKAWNGVMDLVLEEKAVVVGVDYKLMAEPSSISAEYEQQKKIYTATLKRLFPEAKVDFEFWWLA